jgi:hypothetical protein
MYLLTAALEEEEEEEGKKKKKKRRQWQRWWRWWWVKLNNWNFMPALEKPSWRGTAVTHNDSGRPIRKTSHKLSASQALKGSETLPSWWQEICKYRLDHGQAEWWNYIRSEVLVWIQSVLLTGSSQISVNRLRSTGQDRAAQTFEG